MNLNTCRRFLPYGMAIASTGFALLLTLWLEPLLHRTLGSFFYIAIIFSTWYGGLQPGIVAIVLSALMLNYFFIPPIYQLQISQFGDIIRLGIFSLVAFVINLLNTDLRNSKRKIEQLHQKLLEENADRLRMVLMAARMGMWDWKIVTGEITWSPEHEQLFGLAPGTFDGRYETFDACLHPDDRERLNQAVKKALQNHIMYQHEFRVIWADGSTHWIEGRGRAFYSETGQAVRMIGTVMDIDQRKQTEAALSEAKAELETRVAERTAELTETNAQLQAELCYRQQIEAALKQSADEVQDLYENAPCGYHSLDGEGRFIRVNHTELNWLGYHREEIIGKKFTDLIAPESLSIFQENFPKFKQQGWIDNLEFHLIRKDGLVLPVSLSATAIYDASDTFLMSRSTIFNISERKRTEAAMSQLAAIVESSEDAIISKTLDGTIISWNTSAEKLFGYTAKEAIGDSISLIIPADRLDEEVQILNQLQQGEHIQHYETIRRRKDGILIDISVTVSPVKDTTGKIIGISKIARDITEQRAIDRMKTEFISIVSHELRTPLTAIRGSLGLVAQGIYDKKPEKKQRMIEIATDQSDRLVRLVNDILDLQRLESGRMRLVMQVCDAETLMQQSADTMRSYAEQQQIQIQFVMHLPSIQIWAAPDAIIQTLTNLLSNAIKFSSPGGKIWLAAGLLHSLPGGTAPPQANSALESATPAGEGREQKSAGDREFSLPPSYALFSIQDEGRGIPADKLEIIFERFQQVDASDSREKGGTGLGLAICRKIIEQHGGRIWAESVLGEGSTFYFTLPLAR